MSNFIDNQEYKIEQILQNGIEYIFQAFELNKISNKNILKQKDEIINDLNNKFKILKKENELLTKENELLTKENVKLKNDFAKLKSSIKSNTKQTIQLKRNIVIPKIKTLFDLKEESEELNESNNEKINNGFYSDRKNINLDHLLYQKNENLTSRIESKQNVSPYINEIRIPLNNIHTNSNLNLININNKKYEKIESKINTLKRNFSSKILLRNLENNKLDNENIQHETLNISTDNNNLNVSKFHLFEKKIEKINKEKDNNERFQNSNKKVFGKEFLLYSNIKECNYSENSKQTENITNFLNQCKIYLTPKNFEYIVNIFQKFKDGYINEDNVVIQTKNLLQNNQNLIKLFDSIFVVE